MQLRCNVDICNASFTCTCLSSHSFNKYLFTLTDQGPKWGKLVLTEQSETLTVINHIRNQTGQKVTITIKDIKQECTIESQRIGGDFR